MAGGSQIIEARSHRFRQKGLAIKDMANKTIPSGLAI